MSVCSSCNVGEGNVFKKECFTEVYLTEFEDVFTELWTCL